MSNLVGNIVGDRYRVDELVGQGAMGFVYRAIDLQNDRTVALKVMKREVEDRAAPERFLQEARALATVDNKNIVDLYAFDRDMRRGLLFVAMEYADGDDLLNLVDVGRTSIPLVFEVVQQVCSGLVVTHDVGILHRDLKPANIKLCPGDDGRITVKILDFGLVRMRGSKADLTDQGKAPGTLSYMSPEELQELELDDRVDLYSLGVIALEMLTGHKPFQGKTPLDTAKRILNDPPPAIQDLLPERMPDDVAQFFLKLVEKDRDDRHRSARQVYDDILNLRKIHRVPYCGVGHMGRSKSIVDDYGILHPI